jgi:hypothetical protein
LIAPGELEMPVERMERVSTGLLDCDAVEISDVRRAELEAFIAGRYERFFGAKLGAYLPHLLSLRSASGRTRAALGYRGAAEGRLFVEDYLDAPAQQCVAQALGMPVDRATLVEVGNLAADPGLGRSVVATMTRVLHELGFRHVLFAATGVLRASFGRLGLAPVLLASADPQRLQNSASQWGSYYDHRPQVLCGDLSAGLALLVRQPGLVKAGAQA